MIHRRWEKYVKLENEKRKTKRNIPHRVPRTVKQKIQRPHNIYTDRSKEEEKKKEYTVITDQQSTQRRIRDQ
jgi:hypothetical protein